MKTVAWGGVEAVYSPDEELQMGEIKACGDKPTAWFIHLCKAELDARLVSETEPASTAGASVARPASNSAQNDEKAPIRRGGRWRPLDGQVSLLGSQ